MTERVGTLYVVSTPIGNLGDMTFRAVDTLRAVVLIAAEDTRHTSKLLSHYAISTPVTSYYEHNQARRAPELVRRLVDGDDIALVSDSGTPGISDPGYVLIARALSEGVPIVTIPGACALVAAASVSGLPLHEFLFAGFCSPKSGRRRSRFESLCDTPSTLIFYESPHRLVAFLRDACDVFGDRQAVAARELTKVHEETLRAPLSDLLAHFEAHAPRGEFTILIAGREGRVVAQDDGSDSGEGFRRRTTRGGRRERVLTSSDAADS